ncbi:MAG: dicarboxylate/amino acid:cation symporter [Mitsuokella sp.]|uniref:dicarboxylate/amino acid:cation symporter n=1 Tax=Mitsuokella sp. TaxID=2049034 RepID=UPI003EFED70D
MRKHVSLTTSIFIMMILGMAAGYVASDLMVQLKFVGDIFLRLIQMSIVLLVMGSVVEAIASLDLHSLGRLGTKAFFGFSITTVAAATIGLILANILTPGAGISYGQDLTTNVKGSDATLASIITNFFPKNIVQSIADGNTIQVIVFALFLGVAINIVMERTQSKELLHLVRVGNECLLTIVRLVMKLAPVGIFSLLGWAIGKYGFAVILPLFKFLGAMAIGAAAILTAGITMASLYARVSPFALAHKVLNMGIVAFTTTSSAVTLPVKMADSENKIGISRRVSRLINPLGMTLNSDGLALYLALACITVAQFFGIELSIGQQVTIVVMATLATLGTVVVPGGGLVALAIVLPAVGLPIEGVALLAGIDWFSGMFRTVLNVIDDVMVALIIAVSEGEFHREIFDHEVVPAASAAVANYTLQSASLSPARKPASPL